MVEVLLFKGILVLCNGVYMCFLMCREVKLSGPSYANQKQVGGLIFSRYIAACNIIHAVYYME